MYETPSYVRKPPAAQALTWVAECVGGTVTGARYLPGGISHSNFALSVDGGRYDTVVLRRWVKPGWKQTEPDQNVELEIAALELVIRNGIAAPRPLAADPDGTRCGVPAVLMTYVPGAPPSDLNVARPACLAQLAELCAALHDIPAPWPGIPRYRAYNDLNEPAPPRLSGAPRLWERAYEAARQDPPPATTSFLHRDFHAGNTLWAEDRLIATVDWTSACYGPTAIDISQMRWNLVVSHGQEVADAFLRKYQRHDPDPRSHHPYWDLHTVVDLMPLDGLTPAMLAQLEPYLRRLLSEA